MIQKKILHVGNSIEKKALKILKKVSLNLDIILEVLIQYLSKILEYNSPRLDELKCRKADMGIDYFMKNGKSLKGSSHRTCRRKTYHPLPADELPWLRLSKDHRKAKVLGKKEN